MQHPSFLLQSWNIFLSYFNSQSFLSLSGCEFLSFQKHTIVNFCTYKQIFLFTKLSPNLPTVLHKIGSQKKRNSPSRASPIVLTSIMKQFRRLFQFSIEPLYRKGSLGPSHTQLHNLIYKVPWTPLTFKTCQLLQTFLVQRLTLYFKNFTFWI